MSELFLVLTTIIQAMIFTIVAFLIHPTLYAACIGLLIYLVLWQLNNLKH